MMTRSIRGRFLLVSVTSVLVALLLASLVLISLFTRSLEARIDQELTSHVNNLAGSLRFAADGTLELPDRPIDRRFEEAYGGLYWQVEDDGKAQRLRSASLWDYALPLPGDEQETGAVHRYRLPGPEGHDLIVQERKITFAAPGGARAIRIAAAMDASVVDQASRGFAMDLIPYMSALAAFLIAASLAQLTFGLKPIASVSQALDRIRERKAERMTGPFPAELQGVVNAVNQLLDAQTKLFEKARSRAADLAHGLKTPLTVLSNDAATLRERGETDIADELAHLASVMQAHVNHELARSRIVGNAAMRQSDADLGVSIARLVRTLKRTPQGEALHWDIAIPEGTTVALDPQDLSELLGNLMENASKWSRTTVSVRATQDAGTTRLVIEDDGPGVDPADLKTMRERGKRLDLTTQGTGIGLAIVSDIAEVYGLGLTIENVDTGGLRVSLTF
ncbi:HAMP domain-containing sensor histidine kinase [Rhizobium sp. RU36D]|uniref:sensor histidine kinase n=1 Tax=Rhizobium sp. RU36D TaxID=1907415 RepID=UPI0009D8BE10|nr:HAMP domain-containing sensor histidine kinase [Rhizobium sp. RU36D]SMD02838.1 Signal transduction histidine kinase [Rhizobium sp. RU36D]